MVLQTFLKSMALMQRKKTVPGFRVFKLLDRLLNLPLVVLTIINGMLSEAGIPENFGSP